MHVTNAESSNKFMDNSKHGITEYLKKDRRSARDESLD